MSSDKTIEKLIQYAFEINSKPLESLSVVEAKRRILDSLACAVAGRKTKMGDLTFQTASRYSGLYAATIWGSKEKSSVEMASFANGTFLRCLDLSDMYRTKSGGHPSDVIAPILCAAECFSKSGEEAIRSVILAYDIYCSFCDSIDVNSMGFDQPLYTSIAVALSVATLLQLDKNKIKHALSLSIIPNLSLFQTRTGELSEWKGCAAANASRNALFAVLLAKDGYSSPELPIEGSMGLWKILGSFEWNFKELNISAIRRTHFKAFPICYHGQAAVFAAISVYSKIKNISHIKSIEIRTYKIAFDIMANDRSRWNPKTRETADHSLPFVVAMTLLKGTINEESLSQHFLENEELLQLMKKITVKSDDDYSKVYPSQVPCHMKVCLDNNDELNEYISFPKGHVSNPMNEIELNLKALVLLMGSMEEHSARKIIKEVSILDKSKDIKNLIESLCVN